MPLLLRTRLTSRRAHCRRTQVARGPKGDAIVSTSVDPTSFGPNEWLVDEIYEQYLTDRNSVDPAWWEFFEGYVPSEASPVAAAQPITGGKAPAAPPITMFCGVRGFSHIV